MLISRSTTRVIQKRLERRGFCGAGAGRFCGAGLAALGGLAGVGGELDIR